MFFLLSCQPAVHAPTSTETSVLKANTVALPESEVQETPLIGEASEPKAEISGMAWCGTNLILLPQYPDRFNTDGKGHVFSIDEGQLEAFFQGTSPDGIEPEWIVFEANGIENLIDGFEGFETIVFHGSDFYISIESRQKDGMVSYFLKGEVEGDCSRLVLDIENMQSIETPTDISNLSYETMLIYQDSLYAIYEANGAGVNPNPAAHVFDLDLESHSEIKIENIEYRITDATELDADGTFWVMNYFFPGDSKLLPSSDPIAAEFGLGETHQESETVERLLKFIIDNEGIHLTDDPPIYLELLVDDSRNWEGVVRYGDGFLLVTDKFPTTILAYVEAGE